jgi:hypothetical protein
LSQYGGIPAEVQRAIDDPPGKRLNSNRIGMEHHGTVAGSGPCAVGGLEGQLGRLLDQAGIMDNDRDRGLRRSHPPRSTSRRASN